METMLSKNLKLRSDFDYWCKTKKIFKPDLVGQKRLVHEFRFLEAIRDQEWGVDTDDFVEANRLITVYGKPFYSLEEMG